MLSPCVISVLSLQTCRQNVSYVRIPNLHVYCHLPASQCSMQSQTRKWCMKISSGGTLNGTEIADAVMDVIKYCYAFLVS